MSISDDHTRAISPSTCQGITASRLVELISSSFRNVLPPMPSALKEEPRQKTWGGLEKRQCLVSRHRTARALFYRLEGGLRITTRLVSL